MGGRFLILQLRPEAEASDDEFAAFLRKGGLAPHEVRRVRLERERLPGDLGLEDFAGVIVGGGPGCVSDTAEEKSPQEARIEAEIRALLPQVVARDMPFLGCCYGIGLLADHLGAPVSKARWGEPVGGVACRKTAHGAADPLLAALPEAFHALVGHKEAVQALPEGCVHLVASAPCPFQMIRHGANVYATQFHPEADAEVFALRIRVYREKGYFPPETAEALIEAVRGVPAGWPGEILRGFVARYR